MIANKSLPCGLFVSNSWLGLVAYDDLGRIQALVESTDKRSIDWGDRLYESYRSQSTGLTQTDVSVGTTKH